MARVRPACPRHLNSKVWLDGHYGKDGHRRQRYKCLPLTSDAPHCFTETLPRQHGDTGECLECERPYDSHEGPPTGRRFDYSTRDISFALMEVGKGESDRATGWRVRQRAERLLSGKTPSGRHRRNKDGNTVADWVELFAPPIFESLGPTDWPQVVAIDALPMKVTKAARATGGQGGKSSFNVLGAFGWNARFAKGSVLAFEAMPNFGLSQGTPHWIDFLEGLRARLGGQPVAFICDQDPNILAAINHVFPPGQPGAPIVFFCHWHLGQNLEERLVEAGVSYSDPLLEMLACTQKATCACALCHLDSWLDFELLARARKHTRVTKWLDANGPILARQLSTTTAVTGGRLRVGPLEQALTEVKAAFSRRRGMLHNRVRLNRRLMLMQLEQNGQASMSPYSKIIREELLANGGFGAARYVVDDKGGSSLRIY